MPTMRRRGATSSLAAAVLLAAVLASIAVMPVDSSGKSSWGEAAKHAAYQHRFRHRQQQRSHAPARRGRGVGTHRHHSLPSLADAVERTRRRVKCRDSDVILVSYPKSGTHWLASVLAQIYHPGWTAGAPANVSAADDDGFIMADVPAMYKFHGFPVYWLLPGTNRQNAVVPDEVFDAVEAVPTHVPRIFLSHMPAEHFEYEPAPGTKVFYIMRDPHAVWASLLNFMSRRVVLAYDDARSNQPAFSPSEITELTRDFVRGEVRLPPRGTEHGPEFAWNAHVLGWWRRLAAAAAANDGGDSSSSSSGGSSSSSSSSNAGGGVFVNFGAAMASRVAAVQQVLDLCTGNSNGTVLGQATRVPATAAVIAARASRRATARVVAGASSHPSTAREAAAHFPGEGAGTAESTAADTLPALTRQQHAEQRPAWADAFAALPLSVQAMFDRSHPAWHLLVRGTGESAAAGHGADDGTAVLRPVLPGGA